MVGSLTAQTAQDYFKLASKKYKEKNYAASAVDYTRAIELSPNSAVLYNNRGLAYFKIEKWDKALEDYNTCITLDKDFKQAYLNKGNLNLKKGEYEEALLNFDKVLQVDSLYTTVYIKKASALYQLSDYKEALVFYTKAIENASTDQYSYYNGRGTTYEMLGDYNKAISDYDKALSLNPKSYQTFINRGILQTKAKRYNEAIKDFTVAQNFAGMNGVGYYYRGLCRIGKVNAIKSQKEKQFVMDLKESQQLLELACSDLDKAKTFSYGPAFSAYQEYCVEDQVENKTVIEPIDSVAPAINVDLLAVEEVDTLTNLKTITLTVKELATLKAEIKAEILAELRQEMNLVIKDTVSKDSLISEIVKIDSVNYDTSDSIISEPIYRKDFKDNYEKHVYFDSIRKEITSLFPDSIYIMGGDTFSVDSNDFHFRYIVDSSDGIYKYSLLNEVDSTSDYIFISNNRLVMHLSIYFESDDTDSLHANVEEEVSVFENDKIIYQRSPDCGAPNSTEYVAKVEESILEIVGLLRAN